MKSLIIRIDGDVAPVRSELCEVLGMRRRGRLGDDWDEEMGSKEIEIPGGQALFGLWRDDSDGNGGIVRPWRWRISVLPWKGLDEIDEQTAAQLTDEIFAGLAAVGLTGRRPEKLSGEVPGETR